MMKSIYRKDPYGDRDYYGGYRGNRDSPYYGGDRTSRKRPTYQDNWDDEDDNWL